MIHNFSFMRNNLIKVSRPIDFKRILEKAYMPSILERKTDFQSGIDKFNFAISALLPANAFVAEYSDKRQEFCFINNGNLYKTALPEVLYKVKITT